jgi:hypothetical protein
MQATLARESDTSSCGGSPAGGILVGRTNPSPSSRRLPAPGNWLLQTLLRCLVLYWACFFLHDAIAKFAGIDWSKAGWGDGAMDWQAAQMFWHGISPYSPASLSQLQVAGFGHPPTTPFWFLPLADLDHRTLAEYLGILNLGLALAVVALAVFSLRLPAPYLVSALVYGFVQSLPPAQEHARVIQISVWIALAYALAWHWLRSGRDLQAGWMLGLACTLKLFPGLLVVYLLWSRRWRAVAGALSAFLAIATVMTWRWGFGAWSSFFGQQGAIAQRWLPDVRNASLHGVIRRFFAARCERVPIDDIRATVAIAAISLLLVAVACWLSARARRRLPESVAFDRSFSLFCVLSAFLNPWIWEHYFYLLVVPALVAAKGIADELIRVWQCWVTGRLPWTELALASALGSVSCLPFVLAYLTYEHEFTTNGRALSSYCEVAAASPMRDWLLSQSRYFELINWAPWPAFIALFFGLLACRRAAGGRSGAGATRSQSPLPNTSISVSTIFATCSEATRKRS